MIAHGRDGREVPSDFLVEIAFGDVDRHARIERDRCHVAGVAHERQRVDGRDGAVGAAIDALDAQKTADDACRRRADFEPGASKRGKKLRPRREFAERQPQRAEPPIERRIRVVADASHAAAVQIQRRQRLQHVVELAAGEIDRDLLVASHLAEVLEVANTALVQHHTPDRQPVAGGRLPRSAGGRRLCVN